MPDGGVQEASFITIRHVCLGSFLEGLRLRLRGCHPHPHPHPANWVILQATHLLAACSRQGSCPHNLTHPSLAFDLSLSFCCLCAKHSDPAANMSFSPCLRGRISSPLEAGPSVAEGHHLPSHVNEALEYASKRLGRKAAHITLLAVRRDYQLPTSPIASPTFTPGPGSLPVSATSTPSRTTFPTTSRIEALKQLVRPNNNSAEGQIRERIVHVHLDQLRNGTASPAFSEASAFSASTVSSASTVDSTFSQRVRWPGSPTTYGSVPVTPATPFSIMSSSSGLDGNGAVSRVNTQDSTQFGMKLVYTHPLSPREEKVLTQALEKAAKKFKLEYVPS